jgi:hypothetical protein
MKEPVVVAHSEDRSPLTARESASSGWSFLFLLGVALAIIGFIDGGLNFANPQWTNLDWEFGTLSNVFTGLPVLTTGLGLMCAATAAQGSPLLHRVMAMVMIFGAVMLGLVLVVFALDVPPAVRASIAALKPAVKLLSLKTALMGVTYVALYLALGLWTWRRLRRKKAAGGKA